MPCVRRRVSPTSSVSGTPSCHQPFDRATRAEGYQRIRLRIGVLAQDETEDASCPCVDLSGPRKEGLMAKRLLHRGGYLDRGCYPCVRAADQNAPAPRATTSNSPAQYTADHDPYPTRPGPTTQAFRSQHPRARTSSWNGFQPRGGVEYRPRGSAAHVRPPAWREDLESGEKMQQGRKVTGGTTFSATDPATYCAMANAGMTSSGRK